MMKREKNTLRKFDPFMTGLLSQKLGGKREPLSCLSMILFGVHLTCRIDGPKFQLKYLNWRSIFNPRQDRLSSLFPATILNLVMERESPRITQTGRSECRFVVGSVIQHTWPLNRQGLYRVRSKSTFSLYTVSFPFTPSWSRSAHRVWFHQ